MLADNIVCINSGVIDGEITPYQLPKILTRLIAVKDFLLIYTGKLGGAKLLEKAFSTDELSYPKAVPANGVQKDKGHGTWWIGTL